MSHNHMHPPIQIIATIGPATARTADITSLIRAGMSAARLNFSHGEIDAHQRYVAETRAAAQTCGVEIPLIQDLPGPRVATAHGHSFADAEAVPTAHDYALVDAFHACAPTHVALSYVRSAAEVAAMRAHVAQRSEPPKLIAKIERPEAIANLDEILGEADAIMLARGDLSAAYPFAEIPFLVKDALRRARTRGVPAVVATEMLTSLMVRETPVNADVTDICQAVLDGASATMLSEETAIGERPDAAVAVMRRIVDTAQARATQPATARI